MKLPKLFSIDNTLVMFASFMLVLMIWPVRDNVYLVSMPQESGTPIRHLVHQDGVSSEHVKSKLISKQSAKARPHKGWLRWQTETAAFYAKQSQQAPEPRLNSEPVNESPANNASVFQPASVRIASSKPGDWAVFWGNRQHATSEQLQVLTTQVTQQRERLEESLSVVAYRPWTLSMESLVCAALVSLAVGGFALLWQAWQPALGDRTAQSQGPVSSPRVEDRENPAQTSFAQPALMGPAAMGPAAMGFDASWIAWRQPIGVRLRRSLGIAVVIAAILLAADHFWGRMGEFLVAAGQFAG